MLTFKCVYRGNDFVVKWYSSLWGCSLLDILGILSNVGIHYKVPLCKMRVEVRGGWSLPCHNKRMYFLLNSVVCCRYGWRNFYTPVQCLSAFCTSPFQTEVPLTFASWHCRVFCWSRYYDPIDVSRPCPDYVTIPVSELGADMISAEVLDVPFCMVWLLETLPLTVRLYSG